MSKLRRTSTFEVHFRGSVRPHIAISLRVSLHSAHSLHSLHPLPAFLCPYRRHRLLGLLHMPLLRRDARLSYASWHGLLLALTVSTLLSAGRRVPRSFFPNNVGTTAVLAISLRRVGFLGVYVTQKIHTHLVLRGRHSGLRTCGTWLHREARSLALAVVKSAAPVL